MQRQLLGWQPLQFFQPKSLDLLIETDTVSFRRVGFGAHGLLNVVQKSLHAGFRRFHLFDLYAVHSDYRLYARVKPSPIGSMLTHTRSSLCSFSFRARIARVSASCTDW